MIDEKSYIKGFKMAGLEALRFALDMLDYEGTEAKYSKWIIERELTIIALREICEEYGDNDWKDDLFIPDIINKHLGVYLDVLKKTKRD